jgi:outer membrane protein assembly factor BamB
MVGSARMTTTGVKHAMSTRRILAALVIIAGTGSLVAGQATGNWTQWGGPRRNFVVDTAGIPAAWPAKGPTKLWTRAFGEGHSSILFENGRLYTLYRPLVQGRDGAQEEAITAIDAATGKTIWQVKYPSPTAGMNYVEGRGPHSTPLIVGSTLFATTSRAEVLALDKATGKRLWSHDLVKEYGAKLHGRGYAVSPIQYKGTVIVTMGGAGQAAIAFDQKTGAVAWKNGTFQYAPASPILIDVDGQTQLVAFGGDRIAGLDPASGRTLWTHAHKTDFGLNISTPVWSDHLLFISSAYGTGSRALELTQTAGKTTVNERWASTRMRVHIGTVIRIGNYAYGSSGDFGPAFISAIDMTTGAVLWQDRSFARAQLLHVGDKVLLLDEDGTLALVTVSLQGMKVLAKTQLLERLSWTPPTLVGTTLYVRDRNTVAAYDLGAPR